MKLLIAHNDYARPSGEECALESLARLLKYHGNSIASMRRSSEEIRNSLPDKTKALLAGVSNPWAAREMADALDSESPDLVLIQNIYPLLSPSIFAKCRKSGIPVVMRCPNYRLFCPNGLHLSHGQLCERCLGGREYWCVLKNCEENFAKSFGYALRNAAARISRRISDNVDTFIVLSEFQKRRFMDQGIAEDKLAILPNIMPDRRSDISQIENSKSRNSVERGTWNVEQSNADLNAIGDLIGFAGRISPEKGIEDFVAAAKALPGLPFAVAGGMDQMPELVASSPHNVKWFGFLKDKELDSFYSQCRIVVFPSRWFEGFPNVVNNAMAMRKPVLACRIGALPEIVENGKTGLLFEVGNVAELASKIAGLYGDPEKCRAYGNAGRAKAEREYSADVVYERLMGIFAKVLNGHKVERLNV